MSHDDDDFLRWYRSLPKLNTSGSSENIQAKQESESIPEIKVRLIYVPTRIRGDSLRSNDDGDSTENEGKHALDDVAIQLAVDVGTSVVLGPDKTPKKTDDELLQEEIEALKQKAQAARPAESAAAGMAETPQQRFERERQERLRKKMEAEANAKAQARANAAAELAKFHQTHMKAVEEQSAKARCVRVTPLYAQLYPETA